MNEKNGVGECSGRMEHIGRQLMVDCSKCSGPARLEERRCFMGLSSRLLPGFTGEIILRSLSDRRYAGGIVDALPASSEILDTIDSLGKEGKRGAGGRLERSRSSVRASYSKDPASLLLPHGPLVDMSRAFSASGNEEGLQDIERLKERVRRMIGRLDGG
ncbi:MAG: hypothetical protein QCI82_07660 [Candidatus Thermoplasmatota archaeon]|nr:hypothetical protein [Candidatus Thermoplasmatota archaeon]